MTENVKLTYNQVAIALDTMQVAHAHHIKSRNIESQRIRTEAATDFRVAKDRLLDMIRELTKS